MLLRVARLGCRESRPRPLCEGDERRGPVLHQQGAQGLEGQVQGPCGLGQGVDTNTCRPAGMLLVESDYLDADLDS